jgi:tRNA(Ile)-lysidine synthase
MAADGMVEPEHDGNIWRGNCQSQNMNRDPAPTGLTSRFNIEMTHLGPFEHHPRLAVAVSGGADSMALTLLAHDWVNRSRGEILALTVDHGLRATSSDEADSTLRTLASLGIPGQKLALEGLDRGPGLAERARDARYAVLLAACEAMGIPHLLLGHHRSDQVETVMMRVLSSSTVRGLAGMAAVTETRRVRMLRPLLHIPPIRLRDYLTERGVTWVDDPSNRDPGALRARLRVARADPNGTGEGTAAVAHAARRAGAHRAERDRNVARILAVRATIRPEGYALLTPGPIDPEALAVLLRTIAGAPYAPPIDRVAQIARDPGPATLGGVRIVPAGRLGLGWLLVREPRAMQASVKADPDAIWDSRFRLTGAPPADPKREPYAPDRPDHELLLGALGSDSVRFRARSGLPSLVLHSLPALRQSESLIAIPHIGFGDSHWRLTFDPRNPAAGAPFSIGRVNLAASGPY